MAVRIENFANARVRSNHKAVKCVNAEGRKCKYIAKFTCLPVRELASVPGWPPPSIRWAHIPTVCACALPLLTDRSNWQSRWRLQPCDPQTGLRTDTTQATDQRGWVWWGCKTAGVCVNVYGICFYACSKFWACSLPSKFHSCYRGQQSRGFFNSSSKLKLPCKA